MRLHLEPGETQIRAVPLHGNGPTENVGVSRPNSVRYNLQAPGLHVMIWCNGEIAFDWAAEPQVKLRLSAEFTKLILECLKDLNDRVVPA